MFIADTIEIGPPYGFRGTSYEVDIVVGGETYSASTILNRSDVEAASGAPGERANVTLSLISDTLYASFADDLGPAKVVMGWAKSDDGVTWTAVNRTFEGKLSRGAIQSREYSIEIETPKGDVGKDGFRTWSHEDQIREFPGDLGLEYTRKLADSQLITGWPP